MKVFPGEPVPLGNPILYARVNTCQPDQSLGNPYTLENRDQANLSKKRQRRIDLTVEAHLNTRITDGGSPR